MEEREGSSVVAKIIGGILSLIGNVGVIIIFFAAVFACFMGVFDEKFDIALAAGMGAALIVAKIISMIGNKIDDKTGGGARLKIKYILLKIVNFFTNWIVTIVSVLGVLGLVGLLIYGSIPSEELVAQGIYFNFNMDAAICLCVMLFIGGALYTSTLETYIQRHCKHCGASLKGGDYEYEEKERWFEIRRDKEPVRSKIRFEFTCPECDRETVVYRTMPTDEQKVEKYADRIVGR